MELFEHQKQVLEQTRGLNRVAYYLDMGLGKTFVGSEKMMELGASVNLVICQKSKVDDWFEHFKKFYSLPVYDLTNKGDFERFFEMTELVHGTVGVINYELAFRRPELLQLHDFTLMLDESSLIQNDKAKRSKFILKMNPSNVILLSGTPSSGKYENLWTQIHLLGWTIKKDTYDKQYINWKKIDVGGFIHKIVDKDDPYKNVERLKMKMREHGAVFMKTEECFDLPEQTFVPITVKSTKEYRKFKKDSIVTVGEIELVGDTTLTKMLYERQLCGQYSKEKLQAFMDLVESTQDRLIVFYNFNEELYQLKKIAEELERPVSEVNGHMKDLDAYDQEDNSITLIQYQSGAMGLNLQKANKIVYFSPPLSSELYEQSKKRTHRIGQEQPCFYYNLTVKNSIEERIYDTLKLRCDYTEKLYEKDE